MVTVVIFLIAFQGYACFKLFKAHTFHKILTLSIIAYSTLWIILPGVISIFIYFGYLDNYLPASLINANYFVLYSLEAATFLAVVGGGAFLSNMKTSASTSWVGKQPTRRFTIFVLVAFLLVVGANFISGSGLDYLERNEASAYDNNRALVVFTIAYGVFGSAVIYSAVTLRHKPILITILFISLLLAASIDTLNGSRIAMLLPIFALSCRMHFNSKGFKKKTIKIAILGVTLFLFLMPIAVTIAKIRGQGEISFNRIMEVNSQSTPLTGMAADLFTKFNSFSTGLDLIDGYGPGTAGTRPYIGSLLVFLPRFIFPDRPVAGSIDGTIYGTPARLVPQLQQASDSKNVGVSPYAISIWHFGWLFGGGLLIVSGILNLLLLQYFLSRSGVPYKILAVYVIKIPTFVGVFNSPDVLLKNGVEIVAMAVLLGLFTTLLNLRFRREGLPSPQLRRPDGF